MLFRPESEIWLLIITFSENNIVSLEIGDVEKQVLGISDLTSPINCNYKS
jgi:hypothetical protein